MEPMNTNPNQNLLNEPMPKNWLVESILVTILCCLPLGIAGIVFASQVQGKFAAGDIDGAKHSAKQAALFTKIGFFIGIAFILIYVIAVFMFGATMFGLSSASRGF